MTARLLTAEQVCERFGIPSPRTVRTMRQKGLAAVRLGKAYLFDESDVQAFIEASKTCHAQTRDLSFAGLPPEERIISRGTRRAANASVQRVQQTSAKLKQLSKPSSAQVIALPIEARASHGK